MEILVTGADGFIGKNLCVFLEESQNHNVIKFTREHSLEYLFAALRKVDFIFHLAGINRPKNADEFVQGNVLLTKELIEYLLKNKLTIPILLSSSIQAENNNPYGLSKAAAEKLVFDYGQQCKAPVYVFRLPNVFGKWSKPNYNSVVATFCYNTVQGIPLKIDDASALVTLVYIDDVCTVFMGLLESSASSGFKDVNPVFCETVGGIANLLVSFKESRNNLITESVGVGFKRALYSTYLSYMNPADFNYSIPSYSDERGTFVEMLKTRGSGQISFFTAHPGITRGGHYHHSKNEKFLVISGKAKFKFKHILTNDTYEINIDSRQHEIVETVPGWSHDITNIGNDELVVMLWANEIFNKDKPDTYSREL